MAERLITSIVNPEAARLAKVYYEHGNNEYRVALYIASIPQVDADYFTDDKDDALSTARVMCGLVG